MNVKEEDFRFAVEVKGLTWSVYSFTKDGKAGTVAFTKNGEEWIIGVIAAGTLSEQEIVERLEQGDQ